MTEFKKGDRVKVEFEDTITYVGVQQKMVTTTNGSLVHTSDLTLLGPALPTKPGSVIRSGGYTWTLTVRGWHAHTDGSPYSDAVFKNSMYAKNFTVIYDADNPEGGK